MAAHLLQKNKQNRHHRRVQIVLPLSSILPGAGRLPNDPSLPAPILLNGNLAVAPLLSRGRRTREKTDCLPSGPPLIDPPGCRFACLEMRMKRQRRTLGLLLAGLSIALGVIGRHGQTTSQSLSIAARSAKSANAAEPDALNRQVSTGSLAWLVSDPRCSIGAEEVLRINADEDGLSRRTAAVASRRAPSPPISWLWPAWTGYSVWDASSDRTHAPLFDHGPLHCGARLGWSGCTVYCGRNDRRERSHAAGERPFRSPNRMVRTVARVAQPMTSLLSLCANRLAGRGETNAGESVRISRLPNRAASKSAKSSDVPRGDSSSASELTL